MQSVRDTVVNARCGANDRRAIDRAVDVQTALRPKGRETMPEIEKAHDGQGHWRLVPFLMLC